jgi:hypothetical protein
MNIKSLTDNADIFVVPVVNPEGYQYSFANDPPSPYAPGEHGWRKNRRDVSVDPVAPGEPPPSGGQPFIGVDLNRNYPSSTWGNVSGGEVTSRWRWEEVYCGVPNGGSWDDPIRPPLVENETEAIVALASGGPFRCHIDVHSFRATVGWVQDPGSVGKLRPASGLTDDEVFRVLGAAAAALITDPGGEPYTPEVSPYPTSGAMRDWYYERSGGGCLTFLIEVGKAPDFRPADATAHADAVLPGMLFMVFASVDRSFSSSPTAAFRKP